MAEKLWQKTTIVNSEIERYTVGLDRELDLFLAPFDVLGSIAHITMLESIGLLTESELKTLTTELQNIYKTTQNGSFVIEEGIEDVHSQVELLLTRKLGDIGKKIHSGRSRNDQVLVDLKLFMRSEIKEIVTLCDKLFKTLIAQSENYKEVLSQQWEELPPMFVSSSEKGLGREEILGFIEEILNNN